MTAPAERRGMPPPSDLTPEERERLVLVNEQIDRTYDSDEFSAQMLKQFRGQAKEYPRDPFFYFNEGQVILERNGNAYGFHKISTPVPTLRIIDIHPLLEVGEKEMPVTSVHTVGSDRVEGIKQVGVLNDHIELKPQEALAEMEGIVAAFSDILNPISPTSQTT